MLIVLEQHVIFIQLIRLILLKQLVVLIQLVVFKPLLLLWGWFIIMGANFLERLDGFKLFQRQVNYQLDLLLQRLIESLYPFKILLHLDDLLAFKLQLVPL